MRNKLLIAILFLGACSPLFPPQHREEKQIFFLSDIKEFPAVEGTINTNIIVDEVETNAGLDTEKVAVTNRNQLSYFDNTFWADNLSDVIRSTLIESLENSNKFKSVTTELNGIRGNYAISINVRDFQIEDNERANVKIVTKLISLPKRQVLLAFTSQSSKDANSSSTPDLVNTLNEAFQEVQKDIVVRVSTFIMPETEAPADKKADKIIDERKKIKVKTK